MKDDDAFGCLVILMMLCCGGSVAVFASFLTVYGLLKLTGVL